MLMNNYKTTVGIEIHCELKTASKMFSPSKNGYTTNANSNINEIDFAYPGTLPTINENAVRLALRAALLLNCKINKTMYFDRKNYFYPDLPKGYQITQARTPIGVDGYLEINVDGETKKIGIHDIHIEEDTAKSIHHNTKTLLDFNRCGVPLIEIVSDPDIHTKKEAIAYVQKLRELFFYADISDCKIEEGSMRCDVNVSVSKDESLGTRTETKNVGSISSVGEVVEIEAKRQIAELEQGNKIYEETRKYDESKKETQLMRRKETGNDYRYFPDGDFPPLVLTDEFIEQTKKTIPVMPDERRKIYQSHDIADINIEKIIANKKISDYLLTLENTNLKIASNLLLGDIAAYLNKNNKQIEETKLTKEKMQEVVKKLETKEINNKVFKDILVNLLEDEKSVEEIIKDLGVQTTSDDTFILSIINQVLNENPESIKDYKEGKDRAIKYLMGQIMKATKGSANPSLANQLLVEELSKK